MGVESGAGGSSATPLESSRDRSARLGLNGQGSILTSRLGAVTLRRALEAGRRSRVTPRGQAGAMRRARRGRGRPARAGGMGDSSKESVYSRAILLPFMDQRRRRRRREGGERAEGGCCTRLVTSTERALGTHDTVRDACRARSAKTKTCLPVSLLRAKSACFACS